MRQALQNIVDIVEAAGGNSSDIVRLTWFVTDKACYLANQRAVGEAYRDILGKHFPAMSMLVVAGLVEDDALIEIEATAQIAWLTNKSILQMKALTYKDWVSDR